MIISELHYNFTNFLKLYIMNFRNIADLNNIILRKLSILPKTIYYEF